MANETTSTESGRDWRAERQRAKTQLAFQLAAVRESLNAAELKEFYQVAQALILVGLPYRPTQERQISKHARVGDGSIVTVTFTAMLKNIEMPYGSDRTVLHFILDRAVKLNSRFIPWKTAKEFTNEVGLAKSGKNNKDLRQRLQRIKGLAVSVERKTTRGETTMILPLVRNSHLPSSVEERRAAAGEQQLPFDDEDQFGIELDERFFEDLKAWHVPVPKQLILATRNRSQLQDCILFLYWRSFAAASESFIPWDRLREQLWQDDQKDSRIRERFEDAIRALKAGGFPQLRAEARKKGLWIAPPERGQQMLPQAVKTVPTQASRNDIRNIIDQSLQSARDLLPFSPDKAKR
jgi:hypothetical protein